MASGSRPDPLPRKSKLAPALPEGQGVPGENCQARSIASHFETWATIPRSSVVLQHPQHRLEKRMESLQRVKLAAFDVVIAELEVELGYLRLPSGTWKTDRTPLHRR